MTHIFNDDKYYCLFLIYTKQLTLSSSMTIRKTLHIKNWARLFRWSIYWSLDLHIHRLYQVAKIKKGSLKEKERVKGFSIFMDMLWCYYAMSLFSSVRPSVCPSVCRSPYVRNRTSYYHNFWYTYVKWWYLQGLFFIFSEFWGLKAQKISQNEK